MSEELSSEAVGAAVDALIEEVLEAAGVAEPPVDAVALARHLGLEVFLDRLPPRSGEPTQLRRQYAAAQGLAEHFRGELLTRLGLAGGPRPMLGRSLTGLFADRLLTPTDWLAGEARATANDLLELHERFGTAGHELIARRLLDLDAPCAITIVDNGQVSWRRSNAYRVGKALAPAEQARLRQVQRYSRPCRVSEDGWDVRGWPVHRADWKRELLRSVVEE